MAGGPSAPTGPQTPPPPVEIAIGKKPTVSAAPAKTAPTEQTRLTIKSSPSGAAVRVDGKSISGTTPLGPLTLSPGRHNLTLEKSGYRAARKTIYLNRGRTESVNLSLKALPKPTGTLAFDTRPWSVVYLGTKKLGETPLLGIKLPAGKHTLRVMPKGKGPAREIHVVISEDRLTRRLVNL